MLKVVLLNKAIDLYNLEFISNPEIPTTLVLPSPTLSDNLRERFLDKEVDIITISKFVNKELEEEKEDKAHLIFDLIRSYKNKFKQPSFEKFLHAFNHFTDLRGFTLEYSLIEEILPHFDDEVAEGIKLFWKEVSDNSLLDENSSYHKLAEKFKDLTGNVAKKNIIFYAFNHLNNLQVEMIQSLAKHYNIYVPFLKRVYLKSNSWDWIKWIDTTFDFREEMPEPILAKGKLAFYPENKMSEFLLSCPLKSNNKLDFYILSNDLDFNQVNEIPIQELNFKVKNDLFSLKLMNFFNSLKVSDPWEEIELRFKSESKKEFDKLDFRLLKIISLTRENLKYFERQLDRFDLAALEYVVSLKLPRTYITPLLHTEQIGEIRGKEGLISYEPKNLNIIIFPSGEHAISLGATKYPKKVEECLRAIGPLQNPYLDFLNNLEILRELFEDENTLFLAEYGADKENHTVEQIISKLHIKEKLEVDFGRSYLDPSDHLDKYIEKKSIPQKSLSATKLQSYIDCPRKYYFKYINKIPIPSPKKTITHLELGNIEHAVIGKYLEKNLTFNSEIFQKVVIEEFDKYILENNISPSPLERQSSLIEIRDYSFNGINTLLTLKNIFPDGVFGFEKELMQDSHLPVNGRLDVILTFSDGYGLLDFKRSKSSIGNQKDFLEFRKIQPWFYLGHYPIEGKKCRFLGYINLSDPDESLVFCDEETKNRLKIGGFKAEVFSPKTENIEELSKKFSDFESKKFEELNSETNFFAIPQDENVCKYCVVNQICPKGEGLNENA